MFERQTKLEKVFRRHPATPLFARLAEQALRKDRLMEAQVLCEEGCERFPDYPTGHVILGRVYETQSLWEDARSAYDTGLRLDPDQPAVYRRLAKIYRHLGNPTLALRCLESAARLDPLSESVSRQLKELATTTRQAEAARSQTTPAAPAPTNAVPVETPAAMPAAPPIEEPDGPSDRTQEASRGAADVPQTGAPLPETGKVAEDEPPTDLTEEAAVTADSAEPFSTVQSLPEWDPPSPVSDAQPKTEMDPVVTETACGEGHDAPTASQSPSAGHGAEVGDLESMAADGVPAGVELEAPELPLEPGDTPEPLAAEPEDSRSDDSDTSEVAALGEGLFEEGDLEEPESGDGNPPPAPRHKPAAPRNALVDGAPATGRRDAGPPAGPAGSPPAAGLQIEVPSDEVPPVPDTASEPVAADPVPTADQESIRDGEADEAAAALPTSGSEEPSTGFALRSDDGLRDLVAEIQGPDPGRTGQDETEEEEPFATITLAQLYDRQGFGDRAARIYKQILAADPNNTAASSGLRNLSATD